MVTRVTGVLVGAILIASAVLTAGGLMVRGLATGLPVQVLSYVSYRGADADLYLLDIERGIPFNLTDSPHYESNPYWSPDGRHFSFIGDRDGGVRLYALDTFTGRSWVLTPEHGFYHSLRWMEGGRRLVMQTGLNEDARMFIVDLDGRNFTELTTETITVGSLILDLGLDEAQPSRTIGPTNGTRLITRYASSSGWGLYLVDGNDLLHSRRLADIGRSYTETAGWSPDGRAVYYVSSAHGDTDLFITTLAGETRRLTHDPALESWPSWRPIPAQRSSS